MVPKMNKPTSSSAHAGTRGVLILECVDDADPGSEGHFLSHMFNIMEVPSQYLEIRNKQQFLAMSETSPYSMVHITTHGRVNSRETQFKGFWTPNDTVRLDDFPDDLLKGRTVVSTACLSGQKKFGKSFVERMSAKAYIAPSGSPSFRNAIYFAHWFYHNVLVLKLTPPRAIAKYNDGYKNPHGFAIFN